MANNNKNNIEEYGVDFSSIRSTAFDNLTNKSILKQIADSQNALKVNSMPDYYTKTNQNTTTTGTTTTGTTITGTGTGTTTSSGAYVQTPASVYALYDSSTWQFLKQPFSKSSFVKEVIISGKDVKEYLDIHIEGFTDDGLIDCLEFCEKFDLLTYEIFWFVVEKNIVIYPLYTKFHTVEKCLDVIRRERNKNIIKYTAPEVQDDIEFKRGVNKLKLKGEL